MDLIVTNSYYNVFNILKSKLKERNNNLEDSSLIFCEEKISLLAESALCDALTGSFSSQVFSFGNYTRLKMKEENVLSKEGSIMAITRLLKETDLNCFSAVKRNLASSMYNLIVQLKSSKIEEKDIIEAVSKTEGILKNKLIDIKEIYKSYQKFIDEENYFDQSSVLSLLPNIIENDEGIKNTDVFLIGYSSLTRQSLNAISALLKNAKSVTAIITGGENTFAFVNEVEDALIKECAKLKIKVERKEEFSAYSKENQMICSSLFNPISFNGKEKTDTDKIYYIKASDSLEEFYKVGTLIKKMVMERGYKYCDFTIAVNDSEKIKYVAEDMFNELEIPYFLDVKKNGSDTALVKLILSYIEVLRHNFERDRVCEFISNPLFIADLDISDKFINYLIKYNINYNRFKEPFTFCEGSEDLTLFNGIREKLVDVCAKFNVREMLDKLDVYNRQSVLTDKLNDLGYTEEASINSQIYDAVIAILNDIDKLIGAKISVLEFKEIFLNGITALKLSILPQHKDGVFVGEYKEAGVLENKFFFALELNSDVPNLKNDVSILSDNDIESLENIKVLIEPKIRIINHRSRENVTMVLSAFSKGLFLCCPNVDASGKQNVKSEVFTYLDNIFNIRPIEIVDNYLTLKQSINSFAKGVSNYIGGTANDFNSESNFYYAVKPNDTIERILNKANRKIADYKLTGRSLIGGYSSASMLEDYASCPYKAFLERVLNVKDRESGEVSSSQTGLFLHEIFKCYVENLDKVFDRESSDKLVLEIFEKLTKKTDYAKFLNDKKSVVYLNRTKEEAKKFCYKIYKQFEVSSFKPKYLEKDFNDSPESLPPVELLGGKVKLCGTIDRVDECGDYIRVVDYKTGNMDDSKSALFTGRKLQLYLYSKVLNKDIAGVYYMPIANDFDGEYKKMLFGDSLLDKAVLEKQDKDYEKGVNNILKVKVTKEGKISSALPKEDLSCVSEYAIKISENLAENMKEGFIPASPYIEDDEHGVCSYCSFKGMCADHFTRERVVNKVDESTIIGAIKGEGGEENE